MLGMSVRMWSIFVCIIGIAAFCKAADAITILVKLQAWHALFFEICKVIVVAYVQIYAWVTWRSFVRDQTQVELGKLFSRTMLAVWIICFASDCAVTNALGHMVLSR